MGRGLLKLFRVLFSGIVIICFFLAFLNFGHFIPEKWIRALMSIQFVPSIISYFSLKTLISASFLIVLVLTLLTGRSYCSFLCPLGISQDINSRIGGRIRKKFKRYGYKKPHTIIRYSILAFVLIMAMFSGGYVLTILDPYSIFSRNMTYFVKPVVSLLNNGIASVFEKFDIYSIGRVAVSGFPLVVYIVPTVFFVLVGILSVAKGRLYCNTICPVGTFLGLLSKIAIFRVKVDKSKCSRCGRCAVSCKSSCIDFMKNEIDISRCVNCFNCIKTCPEKGITFGLVSLKKQPEVKSKNEENKLNFERRKFIAGSIGLIFGLPAISKAQTKSADVQVETAVEVFKNYPVCPPGGISISKFVSNCTACSLCINMCPTDVLQPSIKQYGIWGMMQPVMDFEKGYCAYECNRCTEVCPTNALSLLTIESKKMTQIGVAQFIKDNCIVKIAKTACGACAEGCPTKAVHMVPYEANLMIPEVDPSYCLGCGQCENSCPMVPFKAIYVDGIPFHRTVKKRIDDGQQRVAPDDFPF